ncbi:hypothetical protein T4D_1725 [Trichinella pseudospiralis]|uniref:Uncharacterized protein n=1 Tax=Trichinella pseudospiralis TaxID=6337 RepID=A0A0V1FZA3_TRIPS|nr:hypothetical protein T4D_1725 [Trichinella pseudospiralis]
MKKGFLSEAENLGTVIELKKEFLKVTFLCMINYIDTSAVKSALLYAKLTRNKNYNTMQRCRLVTCSVGNPGSATPLSAELLGRSELAALYLNVRERCLHHRDKDSLKIVNHRLRLKDNP